jgi:predicted dehydrogenase
MQWFFGMPSRVMAHIHYGKYHDIEVEDEVTAYLEYPDGMTGCFITTTGEAPGTNRLEIAAEKGRLLFENNTLSFVRNEIETSEFIRTSPQAYSGPPVWFCEIPAGKADPVQHKAVLANVANVVSGREEKLIAPLEEGIRGLELGNAMMLSGWLREMVELPIDSGVYAARLAELAASSRYKSKNSTTLSGHDFGSSF